MATAPAYAPTPLFDYCQVTTANTNRDGTGSSVLIGSGTAAGKRIVRCTIEAVGTVTAGAIRIFISADTGTTKRLLAEILVPATTPSVAAPQVGVFTAEIPKLVALVLPGTTYQLYGSTNNTETFNILLESAGM
jgi:hypothetical protein